ncbi:MAG: 16S rRNA (guanine(966)-N(2))-methyltransferase RsmD [Gammaproteobacteria bacterium]|nr:16S rRNA (guanine(966)-N(2))-methyltransferase RsmD [Gammaproteobacteria bacterium]
MAQRRPRSGLSRRTGPPGRLRIVAGKWRSRVLPVADVPGLRPTSERIRETLFNWLQPYIEGARCLDLFAGSGALGLEALSRGAAQVTFVESSGVASANLRRAFETLDAAGAELVQANAYQWLESSAPGSYDIVLLDPPFADDALGGLCATLEERGWLAPAAWIYLEQDRSRPLPDLPAGWALTHEKTAGNVRYALACRNPPRGTDHEVRA